jgi:hypothetical protein
MMRNRNRWFLPVVALGVTACEPNLELPETEARAWTPSQTAELPWGQWFGAERDGLSPDTALLGRWPDGGPRLAWTARGIGLGFSSVVFAGNRIFTMGDAGDAAHLFALDAADGQVVWFAPVGDTGGTRNPGPRATPCTDGELVFGLGHDGELVCVTAADGEEKWRCNLIDDWGGEMMSGWDYSESPLLDGDRIVCCPGGAEGTVLALDKATGEKVWRSTELTDRAPYSSLVTATIGGVRQYIVFTDRSVAGIAAADGELLWRADRPGETAICATPVYDEGLVFVSSGYGVGCNAFRITAADGAFVAEEVYAGKQMQNHHGGLVLVGGHVYGIGRRDLKCIELRTGKVVWENKCVGKGSIGYADGHLVLRSERGAGELAWVEATPEGYVEKGRFTPPEHNEEPKWTYPVVFGGRLYVRDQDVLLCYDVSAQ